VTSDARQAIMSVREVLQAGGLFHDILAREIVTALFENLLHGLRLNVAIDVVRIQLVAVG